MRDAEVLERLTPHLRRLLGLGPVDWIEAEAIVATTAADTLDAGRVEAALCNFRRRVALPAALHVSRPWDRLRTWADQTLGPRELFAHGTIAAQVAAVLMMMDASLGAVP